MTFKKSWLLLSILSLLFYFVNGLFGIWWLNLVFAFGLSYIIIQQKWLAFTFHFLLIFLLWIVVSYWKDMEVSGAISQFISGLLGELPSILTYIITGFFGGVLTGWAGFLGSSLRQMMLQKSSNS
ncbi:MAG: hypothetical protein WAT79_02380 [Saprospiraceae bacterium]